MSGGGGAGRYGGRNWLFGLLPGAKIDYQRLAGQLWKNSIVASSINWIGRNLAQAPACVYKINPDGEEEIVQGHPLTALLQRPNKFYGGRVLRFATVLSLVVSGNAYWYIVRDMAGRPKELWYLPHTQVTPDWPDDATTDNWITGYIYYQQGRKIDLKFADVIHFRDGLDPDNMRQGLSPLASASREVVTDNERSGYEAALLKNTGVPGCIITPVDSTKTFTKGTKDELKSEYEESTTGDNRGRPMVLSGPIEVKRLALSPEELMLKGVSDKAEERICALIGVPPGVLNLGVGLAHSTYSNREADKETAWYEAIIPRLDIINSELDVQLLPFLGNPATERVGADYRNVRALRESMDNLYKRLTAAVSGPWLAPNEARAQVGLKPIAGGNDLYPPKAGGAQLEPNEPGQQKTKGKKPEAMVDTEDEGEE